MLRELRVHPTNVLLLPMALTMAIMIGCGDDDNNPSDAGGGGNDAGVPPDSGGPPDIGIIDAGELPPRCTDPTAVMCTDEQIQELLLFNNVSTGQIMQLDNTDNVFTHYIDARGGGLTPTESFVYARFTPGGLEKVEISDEAAFDSLDWDIALRRYLIRVNSGVSGPSCTRVGRVPNVTDFASVTTTPDNLTYVVEQYMTEGTCDLVPDGSGLPGAAAVALGSYWTYVQCLQMTGNVFVVELRDGRNIKLQVQSYYNEPGAQDACNNTGTAPQPSGSAQFTIKWAYIP